ncbi:MAG: helix-turn-helix domain-containing protein [Chromatiaceae bacterium]|nr:helix-turn-helix domain-containing protein [Chromatiaceae bacterium]
MTDTLLWSLEEAARQLGGISTRTVRRLLEAGEIEPRRVGRRLLVCAASVRIYVDRSGPAGQNSGRAGRDVREESTCLESAKRGTRMVSIGGRIRRTGGRRTRTQAAEELAKVLELPTDKKPRRS